MSTIAYGRHQRRGAGLFAGSLVYLIGAAWLGASVAYLVLTVTR